MSYSQANSIERAGQPLSPQEDGVILAEVVPEPGPVAIQPRRLPTGTLPAALYAATVLTTFVSGMWLGNHLQLFVYALFHGILPGWDFVGQMLLAGTSYCVPVMIILTAHEAGHFLQARRYGVRASLPYFIPMPLPPIGTMGAVIAMDARVPNRKALFDIGISGPLAGLVPTFVCLVWGLSMSHYGKPDQGGWVFGDPLVLKWLAGIIMGPAEPGEEILLNPILFAGWVGLLITSINLLPVGQLDGGHVLYALLRERAWPVATAVLGAAALFVAYNFVRHGDPGWSLMLVLLFLMGPVHPPTHDDRLPLGPLRVVLGWLTLAFVFVGLTLTPFGR